MSREGDFPSPGEMAGTGRGQAYLVPAEKRGPAGSKILMRHKFPDNDGDFPDLCLNRNFPAGTHQHPSLQSEPAGGSFFVRTNRTRTLSNGSRCM